MAELVWNTETFWSAKSTGLHGKASAFHTESPKFNSGISSSKLQVVDNVETHSPETQGNYSHSEQTVLTLIDQQSNLV